MMTAEFMLSKRPVLRFTAALFFLLKSNDVFKLVKLMRRDGKDINGGGCMKDKDGRLVVSEKDRGKL